MKLSKIVKKAKKTQITWCMIFFVMLLASIILLNPIFIGLSLMGLFYFYSRAKGYDQLINYYGTEKTTLDELLKKLDEKGETDDFYYSPNNAPCDHIYMNSEYIILVNNDMTIIPIETIKNIKFTQKKEIINGTSFSTKGWQNTMQVIGWRGYPNTKYCYYEIMIEGQVALVSGRLIKKVGEEVIELVRNLSINIEIVEHPDFDDTQEIKLGREKFWKDIIPGLLFLGAIILLFLFGKILR